MIGFFFRFEMVGDLDEFFFIGGDFLVGVLVVCVGNDVMLFFLIYCMVLGVFGWKIDEIVGLWLCWMLLLIRCRKLKCINIDVFFFVVCVKGKGVRYVRLY